LKFLDALRTFLAIGESKHQRQTKTDPDPVDFTVLGQMTEVEPREVERAFAFTSRFASADES